MTNQTAGVSCRETVNDSTPNIEILTCTTDRIRTSFGAFLSAGRDVIPVEEDETHILHEGEVELNGKERGENNYPTSIIGSIYRTKYVFIPLGSVWVDDGFEGPT